MLRIGTGKPPTSLFLVALVLSLMLASCDDSVGDTRWPTVEPNPTITESQAIDIGKAQLAAIFREIELAGYQNARVRVGMMRLGELQELTASEIYSADSPRLLRQIWAVQVGGAFPGDERAYDIPYGYGIVGIDAENGDIWLRGRYDHEILVEE